MAFFTFPIRVLTQTNSLRVTLSGPLPVVMALCEYPASFTAEKQAKLSEMTIDPGAIWRLDHVDISVEWNPLMTHICIRVGCPSSLMATAATKGVLLAWKGYKIHSPLIPTLHPTKNTERSVLTEPGIWLRLKMPLFLCHQPLRAWPAPFTRFPQAVCHSTGKQRQSPPPPPDTVPGESRCPGPVATAAR